MATNAAKAMASALLDTWTSGQRVPALMTDLTEAAMGRDIIGVGEDGSVTVNTSESASVEASSGSENTLTKNQVYFINRGITQQQAKQLLNGAYAEQLMRSHAGAMLNAIDRRIIMYLIDNAAQADFYNPAPAGENQAIPAVTDDVICALEGDVLSVPGVQEAELNWLLSPAAAAAVKVTQPYVPGAPEGRADIGLPRIQTINGKPAYQSAQVPGNFASLRKTVASTAYAIVSNVETVTVAAGHGIKVGDRITFDTVTAGGDRAVASTVSSVTATTVVFPNTTANSTATEAGLITVQQNYGLLIDKAKVFCAFDSLFPEQRMIERETNAGWAHHLTLLGGHLLRAGAVKILRTP